MFSEKLGWIRYTKSMNIFKHLSPHLKMPVLSNQCQWKIAFAACNFYRNTSFRQINTKPIVLSLPFYFYVRLHIFWKWKELSEVTIRVNRFEMTFSSSILHNHTYRIFYRMLWHMFQKRGTPKDFPRHNLCCIVLSEKEIYGVIFPRFQV